MAVLIEKERLVIENSFISKEIFLKSGKIIGQRLFNKISNTEINSEIGSQEFALSFKCGLLKDNVKASELKIKNSETEETSFCERLIITFKHLKLRDSKIVVKLIFELSPLKKYLRKYLEFSYESCGEKTVELDFVDFENIVFNSQLKSWTLPKQEKVFTSGFSLSLGQPFYVGSFYFGNEFPGTLNLIEENRTSIKYYSGKALNSLINNDKFVTPRSVVGVAESDIFEQVQAGFFAYIKDISVSSKFRCQYNSWYDHMMNINDENISSSFHEIEKALTGSGYRAIDSYVVDDGWNDYSKSFWGFNSKFPNELYKASALANSFGSNFGLWLGPRGGYSNKVAKFAKQIQNAGNGYLCPQSRDICVASEKYVEKLSDLMSDYENRFNLNYWKIDGFSLKACKSKNHDHMVGGYNDMYYYSDLWEKWVGLFQRLRKESTGNFWINATCYINPSPWLLQFVNSIWIQISQDVGFMGKKGNVSDKDRMLSYRDEKYFDFYRTRQFQFPQRCLYNHDPIYGNEAKVSMSDDDFRTYLFSMAMRGTAFWELYYSFNMMNEAKWRINYSVLCFLEENIDLLSNSVIFGGRPSLNQVYGFGCFNDSEGIVSLRNSSGEPREYVLLLDESIGVTKRFFNKRLCKILPYKATNLNDSYSYGDKISVKLAPYETVIFHFGKVNKNIECIYAKALDRKKLMLTFNQTVNVENLSCMESKIENIRLLEDYRSVEITFEKDFSANNILHISGVGDILGNTNSVLAEFSFYDMNVITDAGIRGEYDFSIKATLDGEAKKDIFKQNDEIELSIDDEGFVTFKVGKDILKSTQTVRDVVQIIAVRERNNVLKLYFNGSIVCAKQASPLKLTGALPSFSDNARTKLYNCALPFDCQG